MTHQVSNAALRQCDRVLVVLAKLTRLGRDRRHAARQRGLIDELRRLVRLDPSRVDHDVIEAERQGHAARGRVERRVAGDRHVDIGSKSLIAVACVQVDQEVSLRDDLRRNLVRDALTQRTVGPPGKDAIEVLAVGGAGVDRAAVKRRRVGDMNQDERTAQGVRIDRLAQSLQRADARVFIAVSSGDQRQHRPFARAAHERYRDARAARRHARGPPGSRKPPLRHSRAAGPSCSRSRACAAPDTASIDSTTRGITLMGSSEVIDAANHHAVCGFMPPARGIPCAIAIELPCPAIG